MERILKYCFSCILCILVVFSVEGQQKRIRGLSLGYDLSRLSFYYFEPERKEMEFSLDMEVKKDIYPVLEYGFSEVNLSNSNYDYYSDGFYFRAGLDRNFLKELKVDQYEMLYLGIRYAYSNFTHSASNISISDDYWGNFEGGSIPPIEVNAHWVEIATGIKGEIFKNVFIGWSFRARVLIKQTGEENMSPYVIPGFGTYKDKRSNLGFTYSIYYRLPMYRVAYDE